MRTFVFKLSRIAFVNRYSVNVLGAIVLSIFASRAQLFAQEQKGECRDIIENYKPKTHFDYYAPFEFGFSSIFIKDADDLARFNVQLRPMVSSSAFFSGNVSIGPSIGYSFVNHDEFTLGGILSYKFAKFAQLVGLHLDIEAVYGTKDNFYIGGGAVLNVDNVFRVAPRYVYNTHAPNESILGITIGFDVLRFPKDVLPKPGLYDNLPQMTNFEDAYENFTNESRIAMLNCLDQGTEQDKKDAKMKLGEYLDKKKYRVASTKELTHSLVVNELDCIALALDSAILLATKEIKSAHGGIPIEELKKNVAIVKGLCEAYGLAQ